MGTQQPPQPGTESDYDEYVEAVTGDTPHHVKPEPIEVRVVDAVRIEDYQPRTIVTDQVPVGATAQRVAGKLRTRDKLTLCARGADVFIGGSSVTTGSGFLVKMDQTLCIESTAAVFAVSAGAATVHVIAELREG